MSATAERTEIKIGDFVTVSDARCRRMRIEDGLPVTGTVVRLERFSSGAMYAQCRSAGGIYWGCGLAALSPVDRTAFRWNRKKED